jgi:hypothetical protein
MFRQEKYMCLSDPNIPAAILSKAAQHCWQRKSQSVSTSEAIQCIASFLSSGYAVVLTGAGVNVDSGLKAYRERMGDTQIQTTRVRTTPSLIGCHVLKSDYSKADFCPGSL